jgi:hypothetical protein
MSQMDSGGSQHVGVPPSEPLGDELALQEPPGWPKVVGIVSIVWGGLSLLCGVCGIGWGGIIAPRMLPPEQAVPPGLFVSPMQMVLGAIGFIFQIALIVGGVATVGRKPAGRTLHLVYASASVVLFVIGIPLAFQQQAVMKQWAIDNPAHPIAKGMTGPGAGVGQIVGWAFGAVFGLGWPMFCLIWFGLCRKRPEAGYTPTEVV